MQLAAHEAHDLHELAMSCVNSVTNMAYFMRHVKDPDLKAILQEHFPLHIRDYNIKAQLLANELGADRCLPVPDLQPMLDSFVAAEATPVPIAPRTEVTDFNDREIATAYLLTLKRAGREYAYAAMEMANPDVRAFLEDAFRMSSRHAYDVWQWMVKHGYYPLEAAPASALQSGFYQVIPEQGQQPGMMQ